jgi:protocatechuate 3,4-dioxygenase, beta subunit
MRLNQGFIIGFCILLLTAPSCNSQTPYQKTKKAVGGVCEGCEAVYDYGIKLLKSTDTLPDYAANEPKIKITGTVFKPDGITPSPNVIIYIYHTNRNGIYEKKGDEKGWGLRHGFIRGWVKTGKDGKYTFYTFRPGAYPGRLDPEHIHFTIKEPDINEYYIDDILFDDDPILTPAIRSKLHSRGGSGIMKPVKEKGLWVVTRNIILGKNIPDYE